METIALPDEQALRARLEQARGRLDGLVRDLREVDRELEALAPERRQHEVLHELYGGLERLDELGGARLFWGERTSDAEAAAHLRLVRGRLDVFEKRLDEIEVRRGAVVDEIERAQEAAELLEEDLYDARREEERRKLEWIVEREIHPVPAREAVMPWARGGEEDERFRRSLAVALLMSLLLGWLIPLIDLPLPERWEPIEVPERLTSLIREEHPLPPPPKQEERKPEPEKPKPPEETPRFAEQAPPEPTRPAAPAQPAGSKGILAFREKLAGLAATDVSSRLGAQARITTSGELASGRPTRSLVATQAPGSSGGINLAALSRDVGGGGGGEGLEGVQVARAASSIAGVGGAKRPSSEGGPSLGRTDEEIQIVFDRHKAALYRLYNRELRRDPTLKGQMVLRLRIEPDGSVSLCELQSSDMNAPQLSAQVVERVRTFDFGAKDGIPAVTILYPIDFLPAT